MPRSIEVTLATDGSSDRVLRHPIRWLLGELGYHTNPRWADPAAYPQAPKSLAQRVAAATACYPCDLLIVHRDAEGAGREARTREILEVLAQEGLAETPAVAVVPVRMTEAWLLFDETAIRQAAGNPNGTAPLRLPRLRDIENHPDPKRVLYDLLVTASEQTGRRRQRFEPDRATQRLGELLQDYSLLRRLTAFAAFEDELVQVLEQIP